MQRALVLEDGLGVGGVFFRGLLSEIYGYFFCLVVKLFIRSPLFVRNMNYSQFETFPLGLFLNEWRL